MPRRLKVTDVNADVMCTICEGYLVDATAIIECLHAFCRTCIVRYLESSNYCPVCDVQVHKTKPLLSIRSDQTLQDVVYKVIPGLYQNEMQRRREFYADHPEAASGTQPEERGEGEPRFFSPKESISLCLQHRPKEPKPPEPSDVDKDPTTRHLNCPAAFTIGHLKKFVHLKFSLPNTFAVDIFYDDHLLRDSFSLMDVAYIYSWKRAEPMKFFYTITKRVPKFVEPPPPAPLPTISAVKDTPEPVALDVDTISTPEAPAVVDVEPEPMEVDSRPAEPERIDVESETTTTTASEELVSSSSSSSETGGAPTPATSSTDGVQQMDVAEPEVGKSINSSLLLLPAEEDPAPALPPPPPPPVPEPTYNSVKVVSAPERSTLLSPTNGFRLKFIHDPELNPGKSRSSKKSGRKGGRSSRHKSVPVRLARLAPYPPPPPPPAPPVTCLTTTTQPLQQHLQQLTVGKLVPSVITTLAPTFVTTLVSTTSSTLCSVANESCSAPPTPTPPQVSSFLSRPPAAVCNIAASGNVLAPAASVCSSSTTAVAATTTDTSCKDPPNAKELPGSETDSTPVVIPLSTTTVALTAVPAKDSLVVIAATETSDSTRTHSGNALCSTPCATPPDHHSGDSSSHQPKSTPVPSSPKEEESSGMVVSTSTTDRIHNLPVPTAPTTSATTKTDSDSRGAFREHSSPPREQQPQHLCAVNGDVVEKATTNHNSGARKEPANQEKSESFKLSVKNSISAEFSDNDDLGCQPDLVVDEQKMDSCSDNEEEREEDAALRKKINAIAEKEDEADVTDDTEADSGRASDMSCPARCEEDNVGSPVTATTTEAAVASPATVSTSSAPPTSSSEDGHRHTKTNSIDHVIKQLYLKRVDSPSTPKDDSGALDLSTCTRKPGDVQSNRPRSVANPVLDFKHRQQTYLPAPVKQHTACPPAPKHPTSSLLMHQLTGQHHPSILQAQLTGGGAAAAKQPHHPLHHHHHHHHAIPYAIPVGRSAVSTSSSSLPSERPSPPVYSYKFAPSVAHQSGGGIDVFSSMLPYSSMINMAGYGMVPGISLPPRASAHQKDGPSSKVASFVGCHSKQQQGSTTPGRRLSDVPARLAAMPSPTSAPAHPRASPSMLRSPHHRSASPAPSVSSTLVINSSSALSSSSSQQCGNKPLHRKADKGLSKFKKSTNLAVFNPDPNGFRQKLVIKNLDSRSNSHH